MHTVRRPSAGGRAKPVPDDDPPTCLFDALMAMPTCDGDDSDSNSVKTDSYHGSDCGIDGGPTGDVEPGHGPDDSDGSGLDAVGRGLHRRAAIAPTTVVRLTEKTILALLEVRMTWGTRPNVSSIKIQIGPKLMQAMS